MRNEELVAVRIQQLLNSVDQTVTPEYTALAGQYSKMCRDLNSRLDKCIEEIRRGAVSNAVYLAESDPPVIEMAAILGFEGSSEWNEICMMYDLEQAPTIRADHVAMLSEAYKDHSSLEPLLSEYRKKAKSAPLKERISLLRNIKRIDAKNPQREEDLARFENERLIELKRDAKAAIEKGDEALLKGIYTELNSPEWIVKPPANVLNKIRRELAQYHRLRLQDKGKKILHDLANAYSNFETKEVGNALGKWDQLAKEGAFSPEKDALKQVNEAREWFDSEHNEMQKTASFKKMQDQLSDSLDKRLPLDSIDNMYHKLTEFGKPVPEMLIHRYRQYRSDSELDASRRHTLKLAVSVIVILAVIAGLAFLIHMGIRSREYARWTEPILTVVESPDIEKLQSGLAGIEMLKGKEPDFYTADIIKAESLIKSRIEEIQGRMDRFDRIMEALKEIMAADFAEHQKAHDLIKEGEILLEGLTDDTLALKLNRVKTSLRAYEIRTQSQRDRDFQEAVAALDKEYSAAMAVDPEKDPEEFKKRLGIYEAAAAKVLQERGIGEELFQAHKRGIEEKSAAMKKELQDALATIEEKQILLEKVHASAGALDEYKIALRNFVNRFPADPESAPMIKVLSEMPAYVNAACLKNFIVPVGLGDDLQRCEEILRGRNANNIWRNDLKTLGDFSWAVASNCEDVKKDIEDIQALRMMGFKVLRFSDKKGEILDFYCEGDADRKFSRIGDKRYCAIKVGVVESEDKDLQTYIFSEDDKGWQVRRGRNIVYADLKAVSDVYVEVLTAPHAVFCSNLLLDIAQSKPGNYQILLVEAVEFLKGNAEINPMIRLQFVEKFLEMAARLTIANKASYERQSQEIGKFLRAAGGVSWLDLPRPLKDRMLARIAEVPDFRANAARECLEMELLALALGRRVREVGYVREGSPVVDIDAKSLEVWRLRRDGEDLRFVCIRIVKEGELVPCESGGDLLELEPLFAPCDGKLTTGLDEPLKDKMVGEFKWPESWPLNMR
ncbi:MAG: hypothetical protein JW808_02340 [Victivallales bacterium]|nr:hypothetical protein [Victivallales bacterium]